MTRRSPWASWCVVIVVIFAWSGGLFVHKVRGAWGRTHVTLPLRSNGYGPPTLLDRRLPLINRYLHQGGCGSTSAAGICVCVLIAHEVAIRQRVYCHYATAQLPITQGGRKHSGTHAHHNKQYELHKMSRSRSCCFNSRWQRLEILPKHRCR